MTKKILPEYLRDARGARLIVQEAVVTRLHEAFLPAPHTGLRLTDPAHDLIGANTVRAQQDDLNPPTCLCRVLRSRTSTFERRRSAGLRVMEILVKSFPTLLDAIASKKALDSDKIEIWFADEARIGQKNKDHPSMTPIPGTQSSGKRLDCANGRTGSDQ